MPTAEEVVTGIAVRHLAILDRSFQDLMGGDPHSPLWSSLPDAIERELKVVFGPDDIGPETTLRGLIRQAERGRRLAA